MSTSSPPPRPDPPPADIADFVRRVSRSSDRRAALVRPLSEAERDAAADRFLASMAAAQAPPAKAPEEALPPQALNTKAAKVIPLRRGRAAGVVAALALAAAAAVALPRFLIAPPGATWTVRGEQESRSADAPSPEERVVVRPDTTLRIAVTLDRPADEVKVRLVVRRGGSASVAPAARRILEGSTLGLEQRADEMLGPQIDGPAELVLIGARELPAEADAIDVALEKRAERAWVVLRRAVVLEGWQKTGKLDVDVAGCASFLADRTCELGADRKLVVWGPGRPAIEVDGEPAGGGVQEVGRGTRREITVPEGAATLSIAIGEHRASFALRPRASSGRIDAAAKALREGRLEAAEAALAGEAAGPPGDAERIALARIAAKIKRRRAVAGEGPIEEAQAARLAVARASEAAGRASEAADDRLAVAFSYLIDTHDVAGAKALLDASEAGAACTAETRVLWEYYRGLWARETGDLGAALDDLERARDRALRVGLDSLAASVAPSLAGALAELGRSEDALSLLPAPAGAECEIAVASSNRGWVRLLGGDVAGAASELSAALVAADGKCPAEQPALALNLSYAEQARGAPGEAVRWLVASRAATRPSDARLAEWQDRLEIQIASAADPTSALAAADRLAKRGGEAGSPEVRFEATFGRGRALASAGRLDDAAGVFRQAEDALDAWVLSARIGQGREALATRLDTAPRAWLSFYADRAERAGEADRAREEARLCDATRRSLSRWIRTLAPPRGEAGARGAEGTDLCGPPPPEGELLLLFYPLPTGVLGVARTSDRIRHARIAAAAAAADPEAAAALAAPFREDIGRAARVRLLLHRSFGALPWGAVATPGRSLAETVALTYGLGLEPRSSSSSEAAAGPRRAIVVLDPRGDLSGARSSSASAALGALGFEVTELRGARATREAVLGALRPPCADVLHFEGHGAHRGVDGRDAGLSLFDGELTVRDVRGLACAPRHVVLAACDTARPSGLALSHAFVERGAAAVLGAPATIDDALAADVMRQLYAGTTAGTFEPAAALRLALRALRDGGGDVAAAAAGLRVVGP